METSHHHLAHGSLRPEPASEWEGEDGGARDSPRALSGSAERAQVRISQLLQLPGGVTDAGTAAVRAEGGLPGSSRRSRGEEPLVHVVEGKWETQLCVQWNYEDLFCTSAKCQLLLFSRYTGSASAATH